MESNECTATAEKSTFSESWTPEEQVQELKKRMKVAESYMTYELLFKPNPDDVIVAVPPKSGTTWILHICHQIRMKGREPDFDDQADVITFLEGTQNMLGMDPADKPQPANPRIFATHLPYSSVPLGGRQLYLFRDQKGVTVSVYHFMDLMLSLKGRVSLQIFASVWLHLIEGQLKDLLMWWEHRHDDDVLLLFFDDLKEDHAGCVRRIAKHINVEHDEETILRVVHSTIHAEMSKHHSKFQTRKHAISIAKRIGETVPETENCSRVRKSGGKSRDGKKLYTRGSPAEN